MTCRLLLSVWAATCLRTWTARQGRGQTPADSHLGAPGYLNLMNVPSLPNRCVDLPLAGFAVSDDGEETSRDVGAPPGSGAQAVLDEERCTEAPSSQPVEGGAGRGVPRRADRQRRYLERSQPSGSRLWYRSSSDATVRSIAPTVPR